MCYNEFENKKWEGMNHIMKLGAQLFSVRNLLKTPADIRSTFRKIAEIGFETVQFSGAGAIDPYELKDIVDTAGLPIVCTHVAYKKLIDDTDRTIREHKIFGCPVIGLGAMPEEFRGTAEGLEAFLRQLVPAVKKIHEAGLEFAYHNHAFEFETLPDSDRIVYDIMLERFPDWGFILDTYWTEFAGYSAIEYIEKVGGKRLSNIHFKDMANDEKRSICPCGDGTLDFKKIYETCKRIGVQNVLVEQDNAANAPDPLAEMQKSFTHLRPILK
jgi:sugar phosphate isomerase/epimerase